jgi:hypothetical protein
VEKLARIFLDDPHMMSFSIELCDAVKELHHRGWHTTPAFHQVVKVSRCEYERVRLHQIHHLLEGYAPGTGVATV